MLFYFLMDREDASIEAIIGVIHVFSILNDHIPMQISSIFSKLRMYACLKSRLIS